MTKKVYFTIEISQPIEHETLQELKAKAFDRCAELLKINPNSRICSVEFQEGYYTHNIETIGDSNTCSKCNGIGKVRLPFSNILDDCPVCNGIGKLI